MQCKKLVKNDKTMWEMNFINCMNYFSFIDSLGFLSKCNEGRIAFEIRTQLQVIYKFVPVHRDLSADTTFFFSLLMTTLIMMFRQEEVKEK